MIVQILEYEIDIQSMFSRSWPGITMHVQNNGFSVA